MQLKVYQNIRLARNVGFYFGIVGILKLAKETLEKTS